MRFRRIAPGAKRAAPEEAGAGRRALFETRRRALRRGIRGPASRPWESIVTNADWNLPKLPPWLIAVAPFLDLGTWTSVVYLWLGFPLGLFWFVGMIVGFAV